MNVTFRPSWFWLLLIVFVTGEPVQAQWQQLGSTIHSDFLCTDFTMATDKQNVPYIAYNTFVDPTQTIIVKKFNGTDWEQLGSTGSWGHSKPSLALDSKGTLYIAAHTFDEKLVIKKFTGVDWVPVGNHEVYPGSVSFHSPILAFDSSDTPYVAFNDKSQYAAVVEKYDGTSWVTVGNLSFKGELSGFMFDKNGTLYLGNSYLSPTSKTVVFKYNAFNAEWETACDSVGLSKVANQFSWLFLSPVGTHYAMIQNFYAHTPITIMTYNGNKWMPLNNGMIPYSSGLEMEGIVFDTNGTPYNFIMDVDAHTSSLLRYNGSGWVSTDTLGCPVFANISTIVTDPIGHFYIAGSGFDDYTNVKIMRYTIRPNSTQVGNTALMERLSISPIPARQSVRINNSTIALNGTLALITDIQGREVYRFILGPTQHIQVGAWPDGIYCLRLQDGRVIKLVKQDW